MFFPYQVLMPSIWHVASRRKDFISHQSYCTIFHSPHLDVGLIHNVLYNRWLIWPWAQVKNALLTRDLRVRLLHAGKGRDAVDFEADSSVQHGSPGHKPLQSSISDVSCSVNFLLPYSQRGHRARVGSETIGSTYTH